MMMRLANETFEVMTCWHQELHNQLTHSSTIKSKFQLIFNGLYRMIILIFNIIHGRRMIVLKKKFIQVFSMFLIFTIMMMPVVVQAKTKNFTFDMTHQLTIGTYTSTKGSGSLSY